MTARVAVVVPNWNGARWLGPCLRALRAQRFPDAETIMVDNASSDDSRAVLAEFPEVRVLALPRNVGFAAAMNAGFAAAPGAEYLAALNNDTLVDPDWLTHLVAALDADPTAGAAGARLMRMDAPDRIDTLGDGWRLDGRSFKIGAGEVWEAGWGGRMVGPTPVLGVCAAAALYRRAMLDQIGAFDPDYFAYMEDLDLALRAGRWGWRCLSVPAAVVLHAGAGSSGGGPSAFAIRLTARNAVSTVVKNAPAPLAPLMLAALAATLLAGAAAAALLGRPAWLRGRAGLLLGGLAAGLARIPADLAKRRAAAGQVTAGTRAMLALMAATRRLRRWA